MPHKGIDSIVAASHLICGLQSLMTRQVDPLEDAVLTIGRTQAGLIENIIADSAVLGGTIRTFKDNVYSEVKDNIIKMIKGIEMFYGVKGRFKEISNYPVVYNDADLICKLSRILSENIVVD